MDVIKGEKMKSLIVAVCCMCAVTAFATPFNDDVKMAQHHVKAMAELLPVAPTFEQVSKWVANLALAGEISDVPLYIQKRAIDITVTPIAGMTDQQKYYVCACIGVCIGLAYFIC